MRKIKIIPVILLTTVLVILSSVAFLLPLPQGRNFWIAYGSGVAAVAVVADSRYFAAKYGMKRSRLLRCSVGTVGWIYLGIQIIFSLVCLLFAPFSADVVLTVGIILLLACMFGLAPDETVMGEEAINSVAKMGTGQSAFLRKTRSELKRLREQTDHRELKEALDKILSLTDVRELMDIRKFTALKIGLKPLMEQLKKAIDENLNTAALGYAEDMNKLFLDTCGRHGKKNVR